MAEIIFSLQKSKMIGSVSIDAFVRETHSRDSDVTEYPIEDGSAIADNIVFQPDGLEVDGVIGSISIFEDPATQTSTRPLDAYDALNSLKDQKALVSVVTGLKTYDDMVFKTFIVDRDKDTGGGLEFTATFQKATIVKSQTTTVPSSQIGGSAAAARQASPTASAGQTSATSTGNSSFLAPIKADVNARLGTNVK